MLKADNTTCVIVMIDTMGPSKLERLRRRREDRILQLSKQQKLSMDINAYLKYHLLPGANGQNAAASLVGLSATNPLPICASLQRKCHPIVNDSDTRATRPLSLNDTNKVIVNHIRIGCEGKKLDDGKIDTESLAKKSGSLCPVNSSPAGAASGLDSSKDHTSNISIYKVMDIENETDHKTSKSKMRFSICLSGDESADGKITDSDRGNGNDNSMMPASRCVETGEIDHNANIKDEGNESCENKESPSTDVTVERRNIDINNHNVATLPQVRRTLSLQPKMLRTRTRKSLDDQLAPCPSDIAKSVKSKLPTSTSKTSNGKLDLRERITKRFLSPHLADTQNISENPGPYLRSSNNSHNQHSRTSISDDEFSHKLNEKGIWQSSENNSNPARPLSFNCMQFSSNSKEEKCPAEKQHMLKRFFAWQQQLISDHKASRNLRYSKRKRDSGGDSTVENLCQKRSCRLNLRFSHLHSKKEQGSGRVKVDC